MAMNCPACDARAADGSAFCEDCGSALAATPGAGDPELRCPACGAGPALLDGDGFCTQCGHRRRTPPRHRIETALSSRCAGVSDIGATYHENQDYFVLGAGEAGELGVVVCDGVSHSQNSMEGARVACEAALAAIRADLGVGLDNPDDILRRAMTRAQDAICTVPFVRGLVEGDEPVPPAQATVVGVLATERRITIGWLGDSRAYWVARDGARVLTTDHSWFNDVVAAGELTAEQARADKRARAIVRSLGADLDGHNPGVAPDALTLNVIEAGVLLVVSDGFYTYADERQIARLVGELPHDIDALALARHLVEHARSSGGADNITVVAVGFRKQG
jgi:PPM family protein phosphatase